MGVDEETGEATITVSEAHPLLVSLKEQGQLVNGMPSTTANNAENSSDDNSSVDNDDILLQSKKKKQRWNTGVTDRTDGEASIIGSIIGSSRSVGGGKRNGGRAAVRRVPLSLMTAANAHGNDSYEPNIPSVSSLLVKSALMTNASASSVRSFMTDTSGLFQKKDFRRGSRISSSASVRSTSSGIDGAGTLNKKRSRGSDSANRSASSLLSKKQRRKNKR